MAEQGKIFFRPIAFNLKARPCLGCRQLKLSKENSTLGFKKNRGHKSGEGAQNRFLSSYGEPYN